MLPSAFPDGDTSPPLATLADAGEWVADLKFSPRGGVKPTRLPSHVSRALLLAVGTAHEGRIYLYV